MEIVFNNVTYKYKNKKLLNNINLTIESNKITGITGDNKTLLCKLIDGIKEIDSGSITVGDIAIIKDNVKEVRRIVSMIHQDFQEQFFTDNVKEEMMFLISRLSYKPKDINKKMEKSLEIVGLDKSILDSNINSLTTGEKKLLQIAISLIYNPDIIIFDEVFTTLDKFNRKRIIKLIKALKNKYNKTVIISSNDVNLLYELTDNIVILCKDSIRYSGKTVDIYQKLEVINDKEVNIPNLVMFTYLAKKKKVKLSYHTDILDLIKDVYKHV